MPLTFSVTDGMAVGFIADAAIKMTQGKQQPVSKSSLTLAGIAVAYFLLTVQS